MPDKVFHPLLSDLKEQVQSYCKENPEATMEDAFIAGVMISNNFHADQWAQVMDIINNQDLQLKEKLSCIKQFIKE